MSTVSTVRSAYLEADLPALSGFALHASDELERRCLRLLLRAREWDGNPTLTPWKPPEDFWQQLRECLDDQAPERPLMCLLLHAALNLAVHWRPQDVARLIVRQEQLSDPRSPALVRSLLRYSQSISEHQHGRLTSCMELLDEAVALCGQRRDHHWWYLVAARVRIACTALSFARARDDIVALEAREALSERQQGYLHHLRLRLSVVTGRFGEAQRHHEALLACGAAAELFTAEPELLLLVRSGRFAQARELTEVSQRRLPEPMALWSATVSLHQRDYQRAQREIEAALGEEDMSFFNRIRIQRLLVDLRLAQGKADEARQSLRLIRHSEESMHDRLRWGRLHLLEGDEIRAAEQFGWALERGGWGYVVSELSAAHEMDVGWLSRLASSAAGASAEPGSQTFTVLPAGPGDADGDHGRVHLIGSSSALRQVAELATRYAPLEAPVLVEGETGVGKELVGRILHERSRRADAALIAVNCGALADSLIESELFGHVKGAFTGAVQDHRGLFETASGGTIFLDEIDAMSPRMQAALLRVLENGEIRPIGSSTTRRSTARVVAATNKDLHREVAEGRFRADLYYRLAHLHISIPPLRERREDIAPLVRHFVRSRYQRSDLALGDDLLAALEAHEWPGNVRELGNVIERMVLLAGDGERLDVRSLPTARAPLSVPQADPAAEVPTAATGTGFPAPPIMIRNAQVRRRYLRALFRAQPSLTQAEIIRLTGRAPATIRQDLHALCSEGFIERVITSGHLRTSYFVRVGSG